MRRIESCVYPFDGTVVVSALEQSEAMFGERGYISLFPDMAIDEISMSVAPFVPSPADVIRKMLDMSRPTKGEILYDLGCGDGRIVVIAARDYLMKAVGVEMREDLAVKAQEEIKKSNLEGKAEIIQANFFDVDLSKADVVTLYLTTAGNKKLKPKFEKELRLNSRVVSHDFAIPDWNPLETSDEPNGHKIYLYKINSR